MTRRYNETTTPDQRLNHRSSTEERVYIGRTIEAAIGKRQGQRTDLGPVEKVPQVTGEKTRAIAASRAGFGNDRTPRH